ncbi:uncharacterized protein LACBIDRAFT_249237 [Laccaria bicolor S238N-H82]|uniref:Predicted protein n=1 Tax=Laccaria bicolor (strain S238N-H82 / ATCC MYA-4686) TaxID=486041 RepID=B0D878_LACBS|nr:uncharacterized protein LACBIDRAFT_249237 [Laccaria bicolor S238N-H82]EDR09033.1 predicted protein [Laccaria bicolor S238N-H82]|eukprot:XP_001880346.1 predicted protein [Laccaria bicolor S238N-H82]
MLGNWPRCLKRTSASWRYLGQVGARQSSSASPPPFNPRSTFKLTKPPCPTWNLGHGLPASFAIQEGQESARKTWDMSTTPSRDAYRLLTSAIVPRPIALVSTVSAEGHTNLAPFRFACAIHLVSHNPPIVSISFSLSPRRPKDTRENILKTKEFTVNIISESFAEAANATAVESPADVNEWIVSGLTMEPSTTVKPSLVKESPVCMECELFSSQDISPPNSSDITTTVVLGLIKKVHVCESILVDDGTSIDPSKLRPIARLGGRAYGRLLEGFNLPSVVWKSVHEDYRNLAKRQVP